MKKIITIILSVIMVLSFTTSELKCFASVENDNNASNLSDLSLCGVKDFDDFANYLEENYDMVLEEIEDGRFVSHLKAKNSNNGKSMINTTTDQAIPTTNNIQILQEQELLAEEIAPLGDVNSDGKINTRDYALLMQYVNDWDVVITKSEADVNSDGKINTRDLALLMQYINGWQSQPEDEKREYTYTTGQTHTKLHYSERYLYSTLDDERKSWYRAIDKAVNNLDAEVNINANLSENRNYYILYMYIFDNPEHFYLCNTVGIYNNGDGTGALNFYYSVGNQKGEYCGYGYGPLTDELRDKIRAKKAIFEAEAERITSTIPANAPDVWKEKLIYDRILIDGYYNLSASWDGLANDNWTAYGLLVNKYGVCESYSEAFQTLCAYVGIKCTGVVGTAGGGHKWNAVELDGEWYMCDITFDDPIGGEQGAAYHYYFNRTSQWFIEYNHDWTNCDFSVPECNGTKYDFENYFGTDRW